MPFPLRLAILAIIGLLVGSFVNWGVYALAWHARPISPWSRARRGMPRRPWRGFVPVLGWWWRRDEAKEWGRLFWLRPMLLELFCAIGLPALYWWEVMECGLLPPHVRTVAFGSLQSMLHAQFAAHAVLMTFMLVATFIDLDEQTIPDAVTVVGTWLALLFAGLLPLSLPPDIAMHGERAVIVPLSASPAGLESHGSLGVALAIVLLWYSALLDKLCTTRRGLWNGVKFCLVSLLRRRSWIFLGPAAIVTCLYVVWIWSRGGLAWTTLSTSLLGLACGGGIVWGVRIVGSWALGMEAMGFGDVTLMAMIGAFLGWQSTVLIFFMAPLAALVIAVTQWLITGRHYIAFGPYLCLAAATLILGWHALWTSWARPIFSLGLLIPATVIVCLLLMGLMLWVWRWFRERVLGIVY